MWVLHILSIFHFPSRIKEKIVFWIQQITQTEGLRFHNEVETIRKESKLLKDQGVDIIIVLSHCGLLEDYKIAREAAPYVDVIVGGHSHSFMYTVRDDEIAPGLDVVIGFELWSFLYYLSQRY